MNRARREIPTWVQFASQTEPKQELQAPADLIQLEPNLTSKWPKTENYLQKPNFSKFWPSFFRRFFDQNEFFFFDFLNELGDSEHF